MENIAGTKSSLTWVVNISAALLVILWLLPTLGLFVSSFRDRDQISASGWWKATSAAEQAVQVRASAPDTAVQEGGLFVITGKVFEDGKSGTVSAFGTTSKAPAANPVGTAVKTNDGYDLVVNGDGTYRLSSATAFEGTRGERFFVTTSTPPRLTTENYGRVLQAEGIGRSFLNTLTVTIPATIIPILVAAFAAYALAWMEFPGRALLIAIVVGLLVVPLQLSLIPLLKFHNSIGIGKSYIGIWLAHTAFGLPLAVYLLRNYMVGLPREIIEFCAGGRGHRFPDFPENHPAAIVSRLGVVCHLPVPVDVE